MAKMSGVIDLSMSVPLTQFSVASSAGGGDYDEASFDSFSYSTTSAKSFVSSVDSSRVPVHAYGATALSASGKESNVVLSDFDPFPVDTPCPNCRQVVKTSINFRAGKVAFMTAVLLGVFTCGIGFFIPFFINPLKDVYHSCPSCGSTIGMYKRKTCCS